jgi:hypothetical protein
MKLTPLPLLAIIILTLGCTHCDFIEDKVKAAKEEVNYCTADSDCIATSGFGCPFGCYTLANKNADLSKIKDWTELYRSLGCPESFCTYMCVMPPKPGELKCVQDKCVDSRFTN